MRKRAFYGFGRWKTNVEREVKVVDANNIDDAVKELTELLGYAPIRVEEKYTSHGFFYVRTYRNGRTLIKKSRWKCGTREEVEEAFYVNSSSVEKAGLKLGEYYPSSVTGWIYV